MDLGSQPAWEQEAGRPAERAGRLGRLVRKELLEILRDRRTIITLVLMPILLYPLLSLAFQQFILASQLSMPRSSAFRVGFKSELERTAFARYMSEGERFLPKEEKPAKPGTFLEPQLEDAIILELEQAVRDGAIDLGVRVRNADAVLAQLTDVLDCDLIHSGEATSRACLDFVERRLGALYAAKLDRRPAWKEMRWIFWQAAAGGVLAPAAWPEPRTLRLRIAEPAANPMVSLAALVPLVLILMTITGAVYPAIDLTAGERERGTLEILVAAPVPRMSLLFAKYVSVVTVAVLTALVNLVMMTVTVMLSGLGPRLFGDAGLSPIVILQLFGLLLLFAAFFSAVLLMLTSFARSFKEAQAYLIPLMLVSLAPGLIGMLPGLKLEGVLTVAPLVNIVLLGRDLLEGVAALAPAVIVIASTFLYALAAITGAARIFGAESVLYSEQSGWGDLFRRPPRPQPVATVTAALLCLALMVPALLVFQRLVLLFLDPAQLQGAMPVLLSSGLNVLLFAGFPLVAAVARRVRFGSGFQWRAPPWPTLIAGALLGVCLWPLVLEGLTWLSELTQMNTAAFAELAGRFGQARESALAWIVTGVVLAALAEELFFRGFLFSAVRAWSDARTAVLVSALLFGFFHLLIGFSFERFLSSTILGLLLGWICWRTGSVIPGMILHGLHNAMLVIFGPASVPITWRLAAAGPAGAALPLDEPTVPSAWLIAGVVGSIAGIALIWWQGRAGAASAPADAHQAAEQHVA